MSDLSNVPGRMFGVCLIKRRWFGVSGVSSLGSRLSFVIGLAFSIHCTSAMIVAKTLLHTNCSPSVLLRILRTDLIIRSHTPPIWLAVGGLNDQSIPVFYRYFSTLVWLTSARLSQLLFSALEICSIVIVRPTGLPRAIYPPSQIATPVILQTRDGLG